MKQRRNKILFVAGSVLALLIGTTVLAQDFDTEEVSPPSMDDLKPDSPDKTKAGTPAGKEKKLKIQFDDELVKGQQSLPEAEFIFTRAQFNYKKMIRLRENFIPEVEKGKDEFRGKH